MEGQKAEKVHADKWISTGPDVDQHERKCLSWKNKNNIMKSGMPISFFRQNAMFVWILVHHRGILTRILWETHEMQKEKKNPEIRNDNFFRQNAMFVLILILTRISK